MAGPGGGPSGQAGRAWQLRQVASLPRGPQSYHDSRAGASFVARFNSERNAALSTRAGELQVEKTVAPDGSFTLVLQTGNDRVTFRVRGGGVAATRGGESMQVEMGQATDEQLLSLKRLLSGSKALRLHRILAANLDPDTLVTPAGVATLLTDAFLGVLDGDAGAMDRFGQFFARKKQPTLRRVKLQELGCYEEWEAEVIRAWDDYVACKSAFAIWNPIRQACTIRYDVWAESAWFHFLACIAFPFATES
jgi:hypothetical protein